MINSQVRELTAVMSIMYDVGPEMTDGSSHLIVNSLAEGTTEIAPGGASGSRRKKTESKR